MGTFRTTSLYVVCRLFATKTIMGLPHPCPHGSTIRLRVTNNKERGNEVVGMRRALGGLGEYVVGGE